MNALTDRLRERSKEYGSIPFWSWNDRLEDKELRRQIQTMHRMHMRGFFMHARGGLETPYVSDAWYHAIRVCLDEAHSLGMQAWAYDENGWPSGFAGGKLLENPDFHAVYLCDEQTDTFPAMGENTLAVYALYDGAAHRTQTPVSQASGYLHITVHTDAAYVDTMRADITDAFIEATHAEYERRLGTDFGSAVMPGFFTDEAQYYRWGTPFSKKMEEWFLQAYGYSVFDALPALFIDYEGAMEHRYDYHRLINDKFTEHFAGRIYRWASAHGIQITGHFVEEYSLAGQMMCCGDIMPLYAYEHIPGIDYLGRSLKNDIGSRQLGSVCAQLGRDKALSEMFACCGWDVSPRELKHIAELQYAGGVNVMCQHLYPYSIRGQRKRDYPAFYSEHSLWQEKQPTFNTYFNHLGAALSLGEEAVDTLVLHPIRSAWLTYRRALNEQSVAALDNALSELTDRLGDAQIPYHFGCERLMKEHACVEGNILRIGKCSYKTVLIPYADTIDRTTYALLEKFLRGGGRLLTYRHHVPTRLDGRRDTLPLFDALPDLTDEGVLDELRQSGSVILEGENIPKTGLRSMIRCTDFGRIIYITNLTNGNLQNIHILAKNCDNLVEIDIQTLQIKPIYGQKLEKNVDVTVQLLVGESMLLAELASPQMHHAHAPRVPSTVSFSAPFTLTHAPLNYLPLDRAYVTLSDGKRSELRPMERIRDELLCSRYDGPLTLTFPFFISDLPPVLEVISETMSTDVLSVNGHAVSIADEYAIDRSFHVTNIAPYITPGDNTVSFTIPYHQGAHVYYALYEATTEAPRNCLSFDTEIENLYLRGSFSVGAPTDAFIEEDAIARRLSAQGLRIERQNTSPDIRHIERDGYPFFCGSMTFRTVHTHHTGDPTVLYLDGRFCTCDVTVNGCEAGCVMFSPYIDLTACLNEGDNTIELTLTNSYRNLLGPHHGKVAEPTFVTPPSFSFEKGWHKGVCEEFDDRYALVRFGVDL